MKEKIQSDGFLAHVTAGECLIQKPAFFLVSLVTEGSMGLRWGIVGNDDHAAETLTVVTHMLAAYPGLAEAGWQDWRKFLQGRPRSTT